MPNENKNQMDTNATMNQSPQDTRPGRVFAFWPIFLSILLCGLIAFAVYTLYQKSRIDTTKVTQEMVDAQKQTNAALRQTLGEKQSLTGLPPCDVRKKLSLPAGNLGTTPAALSGQTPPARAASTIAAPGETAEINAKIENATVFVINITADDSLGSGTGFFITNELILTNYHVVENANTILVINNKLKMPLQAKPIAATKNNGRDYAILQVAPQAGIEPLEFSLTARRGERVAGWGYPHAISRSDPKYTTLLQGKGIAAPELVYSDGAVSSILDRTPRIIAHTAPLSHGNSGGPLTDATGKVVGINTQISLDEDSYRQTSFSIHAEDIMRYLKEKKISLAR